MTRRRSYNLRFHVLPWVLAALFLRASIPMSAPGDMLAAATCTAQGMATELIEIPGRAPQAHCDYCLAPAHAIPPSIAIRDGSASQADALPAAPESTPLRFALVRSQTARGPPA